MYVYPVFYIKVTGLWYGTAQYRTVSLCIVAHTHIRYNTVLYGMVQYSMVNDCNIVSGATHPRIF